MDLGTSVWRLLGAFLLVTGILLVTLRLLTRWQAGRGPADMRLLGVSSLGPKRQVERLRYKDEELVIYRSENAMLLLERLPAGEDPEPPAAPGASTLKRLLGRG